MSAEKTVTALQKVTDLANDGDLNRLEAALGKLMELDDRTAVVEPFLRLCERFPDDTGYGVLETFAGLLEEAPNFDGAAVESFRRTPTLIGLRSLVRAQNAGFMDPAALIAEAKQRTDLTPEVRAMLDEF